MTSLAAKADHVRGRIRGGRTGKHHCHWPGCALLVAPAAWGCKKHWYMLPGYLRTKVWHAYRPGQEDTKRPSARYLEVAKEVQTWIAENHPSATPTQEKLL